MSLPLLPLGMRGNGAGRGGPGSDGVGTASQGSPGTSGSPLLGQSTWGRSKQVSTSIFFKGWQARLLRAHIAQGAAKGRHVHRRPICMLICSMFVLRPCWLQRWIVGVFIVKNVWFTAVKFLSLMKSVHCRHPVKMEGYLRESAVPFLPALMTHRSAPFSLQFFLFILIIFLAELSAAILAFIFRENVRTWPRVPWPIHGQPSVPRGSRVSILSSSGSSSNHNPPPQ